MVAPPPVSESMVLDAAMVKVPALTTPELASMVPVASSARVPALIVVAPLYVFTPLSVQVPLPALVSVPAPVPMMLDTLLPVAVPSSVRPNPLPVIVPTLLSAMFPLLATILLALPRLTNPLYVAAVAELLVNAPVVPPTPVPFSVKSSAVPRVNPFRSRVAPALTTVPAAVVPSGVLVASPAAPSFNVPAPTVVRPA